MKAIPPGQFLRVYVVFRLGFCTFFYAQGSPLLGGPQTPSPYDIQHNGSWRRVVQPLPGFSGDPAAPPPPPIHASLADCPRFPPPLLPSKAPFSRWSSPSAVCRGPHVTSGRPRLSPLTYPTVLQTEHSPRARREMCIQRGASVL